MLFSHDMEKEEIKQRGCGGGGGSRKSLEPEVFLQWGNKKRLRCVRVRDPHLLSQRFKSASNNNASSNGGGVINSKFSSRFDKILLSSSSTEKETSLLQSNHRVTRSSEAAILRSNGTDNNRKSSPAEKEDRYYTTRGSVGVEENGKISIDGVNGDDNKGNGHHVWPKLYITLSSKEKEEDFMAMKGCKPPQRPKKRAKTIQRTLLLVSPGAWLTDMCQERYEVREKKSSRKKPRGLKALGGMDSDSD